MNTANAFGFLVLGAAMGLLPWLAPAWFPPTASDGSSGRVLWLETMSVVQVAIGGWSLARANLFPAIARWLASEPQPVAVLTRARVPRFIRVYRARAGYRAR